MRIANLEAEHEKRSESFSHYPRYSLGESTSFDIAQGRFAEEAFVFAGELTYALLARAEKLRLAAQLACASAPTRSGLE